MINWLRRKPPGPAPTRDESDEPLVLILDPKTDMTVLDLVAIMRYFGRLPAGPGAVLHCRPSKLNSFAEEIGKDAFRHFRVDMAHESRRDVVDRMADLVGKKVDEDTIAEVIGRLEPGDVKPFKVA